MDFLSGLNPRQKEAVCHVEGPLLILAGAGSGKTRVITHRIAHLIEAKGVFGPSVLAVTFTNKAAGEMRERVLSLLSGRHGDAGPAVSTFHSFCVRLLRRDGAGLASIRPGFTRDFQIYDGDDQVVLIKQIYKKLGLDDKFMQHRAALSRISHSKNRNEGPEDLLRTATDPKISRLAKVFELYQEELRRANALDFDDLLLEAVRLLRHDAEVRALWNRRIEFLMVDEYQDTNRSQYDLMRLLSQSHANVAVVGDEDQSIYGWRGADIRNILDFEKDYPSAKTIKLERNYRSTKTILDAAGAVVSNNRARIGKWLETENDAGVPIGFYEAADGESEAVFIADTIEKLLRQDSKTRVAVLYRTNFQSRQIEESLRRYNRPYVVVGGFSFYQRAEIKDALAYLKLLANPNDGVSMARIFNVPARGIGKTTVEQIESLARDRGLSLWAAAETACTGKLLGTRAEASVGVFLRLIAEMREFLSSHGVHETLNELLERTGYRQMISTDAGVDSESKLGNLEELISAATEAHERGESLTDFLDHAALVSDADQVDDQARVSLLTMHNAKGLEFPVVFIAGMEEGLFPHSRSRERDSQLEEERRLCYVAMTRAESRLYLTCARFRRRYGGSPLEPCQRSRFLEEVPPALIEELHIRSRAGVLDLFGERAEVREAARRNTYTGKTYNSLDHISQFFADRGIQAPSLAPKPAPAAAPAPRQAPPAPPRAVPAVKPAVSAARPPAGPKTGKRGFAAGATVYHAKYGRGTVIRREGDGDDAKLTVSFANIGIKKLIAKFAQLKAEP
ncbi:MAG: UvrD-helicase domain-containing protein [Bryobacteraceae bacterium]|nr:UvrD-helicase domain-containing protein [Bryobacteraceae bacterium]